MCPCSLALTDVIRLLFGAAKEAVTKAPEVPSYTTYITQDRTQNQSYGVSKAYTGLKDKADIKDNRANF